MWHHPEAPGTGRLWGQATAGWRVLGMKLGAACLLCLLLACLTLPGARSRRHERSMEIRSKNRSKGPPPNPCPRSPLHPQPPLHWGVQKQWFSFILLNLFPSPLHPRVQCPVLPPCPLSSPSDGSLAFALQTRTSTPPGTQGVGSGPWGGLGGGRRWMRAPTPGGLPRGKPVPPPTCTSSPPGGSGAPELQPAIKALFLSSPCPCLSV